MKQLFDNIDKLSNMIGQKVRKSQFNDVFDIRIIITDAHRTSDGDTEGILSFVGKELNSESDKLFVPGASICPIYNEKEYFDGDVMYDE